MNKHTGLENKVYGVGTVELFEGPDSRDYARCEIEKTDTQHKEDKPGDELYFLFLPTRVAIAPLVLILAFTSIRMTAAIVEHPAVRQSPLMYFISNFTQSLDL